MINSAHSLFLDLVAILPFTKSDWILDVFTVANTKHYSITSNIVQQFIRIQQTSRKFVTNKNIENATVVVTH